MSAGASFDRLSEFRGQIYWLSPAFMEKRAQKDSFEGVRRNEVTICKSEGTPNQRILQKSTKGSGFEFFSGITGCFCHKSEKISGPF